MQIPQIYLTLCCGRTLLLFQWKNIDVVVCCYFAFTYSYVREKGLFTELLAAMLSSVIRKERCAHDPFFVLKLGTADGNNFEKAHLTFETVK